MSEKQSGRRTISEEDLRQTRGGAFTAEQEAEAKR